MEELSYLLTQYFVSCVHVCFYFSLPLIFTLLLADCFSNCLTAAFFLENLSLLFSITHSSSVFVIHMNGNVKNDIEKDTTLSLFFLS